MKNIIYFNQNDAEKFDYDRFKKSLNDYAKVPDADIKAALKTLDNYENLHVSRLVETGALLIAKDGTEKAAKKYYDAHDQYFGEKFELLRRITGYLVGTLDRWNDGKKAEEAARVKHSINSAIDDQTRAERLEQQAIAHNIAYARA
jgi:hypothetical protein